MERKAGVAPSRRAVLGAALFVIAALVPAARLSSATLSTTGRWRSGGSIGVVGTHVAVLHDTLTDSTRVLFWGGSGRPNIADWSFIPGDSASFPADTDQASTKAYLLPVPNPHRAPERPADIFCSGHAMLPNGSLLVVGGEYFGDMGTPWAFKFNPSGPDSFPWDNSIATMSQDRWYPTATEVATGKILATTGASHQHMMVFGGLSASGTVQGTPYPFAVSGVSFWDNNSFGQYSQSPPSAREGQAADFDAYWNRMTFFGGDEHVANGRVNEVWGLPASPDDTTYEWRQSMPAGPDGPPVGRTRATMVFVHKIGVPDTAYVFGGLDNNGNALGDLWKGWRPAASDTDSTLFWHWVQLSPDGGPGPRYGHAAVVDEVDGPNSHFAMLIYGGKTDGSTWADNSVWALTHLCEGDPKLTWTQFTPSGTGPGPCDGHAMAFDERRYPANASGGTAHRTLVFGGENSSGLLGNTLWCLWRNDEPLNPISTHYYWRAATTGSVTPTGRTRATLAQFEDRLLLFGGDSTGAGAYSATIWEYDNTDSVWLVTPREGHASEPPGLIGHSAVVKSVDSFARYPESFDASYSPNPNLHGSWVTHTGGYQPSAVTSYEFMFPLPSGKVFFAGPVSDPNLEYQYSFDPVAGTWDASTLTSSYRAGSAVQYRPGRILRCGQKSDGDEESNGSAAADTISIGPGGSTSGFQAAGVMHDRRANHNLTILPNGDVLVTGGLASEAISSADTVPQVWSPQTGWGGTQLAPDPYVRNYHSAALLLPDGRVWSSGGEIPDQTKDRISVYEPPYLFSGDSYATRPALTCHPASASYGARMTLPTSDANNIAQVNLLRPGAVTHGFNQDQWFQPLAFTKITTSPARVIATMPSSPNTAPPGDYLVFLIDSTGVPSVGQWVRLTPGARNDACDTSPPAAATTLTATCDPNHQDRWAVSWTEVADDDTLSKTGRVQWYDVRRSGAHITSDNWSQADQAGTPSGVAPDGTASVTLDITANTYVRLEAVDDNANWSGLSNEVLLPYGNYDCLGGGMFAGGGGGGGAQVRRAGSASLVRASLQSLTSSFEENSVLDAATLDQPSEDVLRMDWLLADGNGYGVRLREPDERGASVDQVSLLAVDHPAGSVCYRSTQGTLLGMLSLATLARDQGGQDVTALLDGSGGSFAGDSGAVVTVQTAADSTKGPVVVESSSGGLAGSRIVVETQGATGEWVAAGMIVPRVQFDQQVVDSVPAGAFRLRFLGPCNVRLAARLVSGVQAPTEQWCTLSAAAAANGSDVREALSARDSVSAVLSGADTLSLAFAAPSQAAGTIRDLFLVVEGTPLTANMAARAKQTAEASPLPRSFTLRQNQPNPFHGTTAIHFDLPVGQVVRLEIFDAQGRRVRTLANRFYPAGSHVVSWDQRDDDRVALRPGVCFYRVETQVFRDRKKMVILP